MGEQNQETGNAEPLEELFEPMMGYLSDEIMLELEPVSTEKQRLVEMRRLAEQRLEQKRLRDELGDYDLQLDDY
jgi:hypothetical protein